MDDFSAIPYAVGVGEEQALRALADWEEASWEQQNELEWPPTLTAADIAEAQKVRVHMAMGDDELFTDSENYCHSRGYFRGMAVTAMRTMLDGEWHTVEELGIKIHEGSSGLRGGLLRVANAGLVQLGEIRNPDTRRMRRLYRITAAGRRYLATYDARQEGNDVD